MEINHYGDTILGVLAGQDIVEGRMVILTGHAMSIDFGSQTDLPAVRVPATSAEAALARYCVTFAVDNRSLPIYQSVPSFTFALRGGFDQSSNVPFSATVRLTYPGNQEGATIPSGSQALAFGEGIYTVPSGAFVYSAALTVPGTMLDVADTATDGAPSAGMLKAGSTAPVAQTIRYDSSDNRLTFKILH